MTKRPFFHDGTRWATPPVSVKNSRTRNSSAPGAPSRSAQKASGLRFPPMTPMRTLARYSGANVVVGRAPLAVFTVTRQPVPAAWAAAVENERGRVGLYPVRIASR